MNQKIREAMRAKLDHLIEEAGTDGIGFRALWDRIKTEFPATRRAMQDQLTFLENGGIIRTGGLSQNLKTYVHMRYRQGVSEREKLVAEIYKFRELKSMFGRHRPARFDVR